MPKHRGLPKPRRTLRLRAKCPVCGSPPAVQVFEYERERYLAESPDTPILRVQCRRHGCGEIYEVVAKAFQEAS